MRLVTLNSGWKIIQCQPNRSHGAASRLWKPNREECSPSGGAREREQRGPHGRVGQPVGRSNAAEGAVDGAGEPLLVPRALLVGLRQRRLQAATRVVMCQ